MKNNLAILFLFLLCISAVGQKYKFKVKQFNIGDGIAHTDATAFAQDSNGFIWLGTYAGLNKFDGYQFELFRSYSDQLSSPFTNRIMGLSFENNLLFMATQGGLAAFKTDTEIYLHISYKNLTDNTLKQTRINHVYAKNGKLFLVSSNQIHVFDYSLEGNTLVLDALNIAGEKSVGTIQSILYQKKNLWLSGSQGLFRLSANASNTSFYLQNISTVNQFGKPIEITNGIFLDDDNKLWAGGQNSLHQLDLYTLDVGKLKGHTFKNFDERIKKGLGLSKLTNFQVSNIRKTDEGSIWIGTDYGLVQLKMVEQDFDYTFYTSENNLDRNQISSKRVNGLFEDQDNNLWITTFGGGVNYIDLKQNQFYHLSMEYPITKEGLGSNFIRALVEDNKGNLWIGTERNGLFYYDFKTKNYRAYLHKDNDANSILSDAIRSLKIDDNNQLWIGSLLGISVLDPESGRMEHLTPDPNKKNGLTGNNIFDIQQDKFGAIWAGSWANGLNRITKTKDSFEVQRFFEQNNTAALGLTSGTVSYIYTDLQRPEVLVSTTKGINHIYLSSKGEVKEIKHYIGVPGYKKSLTSNFIWPLVRENDSILFVGTIGGGLNKVTLAENAPYGYLAEKVAALNQAPFSDIESLELDNDGIIWIGGNGLSRYDKTTGDFDNFTYADGLQGNSFKIGVSHYGASGKMYFGGTQGITYFYPNDIQKDTTERQAVLTKFSVNGKRVGIGEHLNGHVILSSNINEQEHIKLVYGENDFTINFSSLSYPNPNANNYRYKLEGYDKEWYQTTGELPFATYSNLDYGDYTFKVSASKGNESWSSMEKELKITLTPPWWSSILAKIIYFLSATTLFYFVFRWFMLKKAYDISIIEKNQKDEINRLRLQFFTNISHEFRTPLTLIINPLQELVKGNMGKRKRVRYYNHMLDNTKRMLRLVNELMDFQKIETKAYELNPTEENINDVIHEVYQNFSEFAISRDITFGFLPKEKVESFWFDRTVLEKILYNILGNAFKYTKSGGEITIELFKNFEKFGPKTENNYQIWNQQFDKDYVWIKISDTGRGIAEREIKFIFDRFFHKSANDKSLPEGSGVGLSLVKSLVNLQKGSIVVTSVENRGTTFYISVPFTKFFKPGVNAQNNINLSKSSLSPVYDTPHLNTNMGEDYGKSAILIVEDNSELRFFMKENFEDEFHVLEAENGEDAVATLSNFKPDLIISDVNMPKMDGIQFCKYIKESEAFSSIPFILLTSNQTIEKQLEGLQAKADLYLSKPFSIEVLKISIQNIISNRKDLKHKIVENTFKAAHQLIDDSKENDFIKKVITIINENIEDNDFDVSMLSDKLGMSRTKVYNKIKEVTGKASGEIIREMRVRKAASLLASEDISVSQAMYKVGIQSQSYFSKVFKKEFGKSPSKFVQDIAKKK